MVSKSIIALVVLIVAVANAASTAECTTFCTLYFGASTCSTVYDIYTDNAACIAECLGWADDSNCANGDITTPALCVGNTYGCRLYHLNVASSDTATLASVHCAHATPLSVDTSDFDAGTEGQCTTPTDATKNIVQNSMVDDFCNNLIQTCGTYVTADLAQCLAVYQYTPDNRDVTFYAFPDVAQFPVAATAAAGAPNNLSCRRYHVTAARSDAATHCPHAATGAENCGSDCDFFCGLVMGACTGANVQYGGSTSTCMTACAAMTAINYAAALPVTGDTLGCRVYHATVAAKTAALATTHCPHTSVASSSDTCGAATPPDDGAAMSVSANLALIALLAAFALL